MDARKYDPNVVITAANDKLSAGDWEGGRYLFQSSLLEWTDDARESQNDTIHQAVATLWLGYAEFLKNAKQNKSAAEAYDEAMSIVKDGRIFIEAARFAIERNKRKAAQDIYIQGIRKIDDEQDQELLWNDFLEMMRQTAPDLTLASLRDAVASELQKAADAPSVAQNDDSQQQLLQKKPKLDDPKTYVINTEFMEREAKNLQVQDLPAFLMAAWMTRDGTDVASAPNCLFEAKPPKLSDPTAKDLLGIDLAIQLAERLLSESGSLVLQVCRGLWTLQALHEQANAKNSTNLQESLTNQELQLEHNLEARLSVAGAAAEAVKVLNNRDRESFQANARLQRQSLDTTIAWNMRKLLYLQQTILCKLHVPGLEPTVDAGSLDLQHQICRYLHSAFYIRTRMGAEPHESMLRSQLKKLREAELSNSPVPQRLSPVPPPPSYSMPLYGQPPLPPQLQPMPNAYYGQQQQQQQHPMMQQPYGGPPPPPPQYPYGYQQR